MIDDFDQQNHTNHYRHKLDDIRDWYQQLPDILGTTPDQRLDLTGVRGTTDRIPGGDTLAMLAPWAPDADHGDDLPHPDQIIREWTHTFTGITHRTWAENWRWHWDHTASILESPWADAWRTDIDALWHRLARLTGNAERDQPHQRGPEECQAQAAHVPDHIRVTLTEADRLFPGIRNRIDVDRSRERTTAKKEKRPTQYRCQPDEKCRYLVGDLREHYGATPFAQTLQSCGKSM